MLHSKGNDLFIPTSGKEGVSVKFHPGEFSVSRFRVVRFM